MTHKVPEKSSPRCVNTARNFTQTSYLHKKSGRGAKEDSSSSGEKSSAVEDPHDFSNLEAKIQKTLAKLQDDLSKLRTGGRFNPELLESVKVQLKKDTKASFRLGDLAQVIPKGGKSIMVLVGEADVRRLSYVYKTLCTLADVVASLQHVRSIISAIQGSKDLNLQPQQDPHNTLQLNIPIPSPTKEFREFSLGAAGKAGEMASVGIRDARAAMQKRLRTMELNKSARPDDIRKAHKDMEKIVEKGNADIKKAVDAARKTMEQS